MRDVARRLLIGAGVRRAAIWCAAGAAVVALAGLGVRAPTGHGPLAWAAPPSGWEWREVPGTRLASLPQADPQVMGAWGGGAWDSRDHRLLIWGGGHGDSYDNSLYFIDPTKGAVGRLTERSPKPKDTDGREWPGSRCARKYSLMHPDVADVGEVPVSRHTYDGVEYVPTRHWFLAIGGSQACGSGGFATDTWVYDLGARRWIDMEPGGARLRPARMLTVYDPASDEIVGYDGVHVYAYSVAGNKWRYLKRSARQTSLDSTAALDPSRRLMVIVGHRSTRVIRLDGSAGFEVESVETGGATEIERFYPGVEFHPRLDRIVAWGGSAGTRPDLSLVYVLTLARDRSSDRWTGNWEAQAAAGSHPTSVGAGVNGRFRWAKDLGALIVASSMRENVHLLRLLGKDKP